MTSQLALDESTTSTVLSRDDFEATGSPVADFAGGLLSDPLPRKFNFVGEGYQLQTKWEDIPTDVVLTTAKKIAELLALRKGWDSYGAPEIAQSTVIAAVEFLPAILQSNTPAPSVVPTSTGGLQLEWHRSGYDIEIEFDTDRRMVGYVFEVNSDREWSGDISRDGLGEVGETLARIA